MSAVNNMSSVPPPRVKYVRSVGPRLRILLYFVFGLTALLGANSIYLIAITALEVLAQRLAWERQIVQGYFYQYMFLMHLVLGLLLVVPFVVFGLVHIGAARNRRNRRAVRIGYALFFVAIAVLVTGVLLMRVGGFDLKQPLVRSTIYWLHVLTPLACVWLYWLHRLAGPRIKWRSGLTYSAAVAVVVLLMVVLHAQDPRRWYAQRSQEGTRYFQPSLVKTATGDFIPPRTLMMDDYCKKCHADVYQGWFHSAHHFSSFNNPAYLASVRETRQVSMKRDGTVRAGRWCAGCHDPVPFLSGAFDRPDYDDVRDATAQSGITCAACHAITSVDSTRGNGDYTIEEPMHYPFAYSENGALQWINNQLVKAKPAFHKKTFLKDVHRSAEFCSTCHKVHLPMDLTQYKDFLRGQNHYDTYLLSGVSGHGARSFYYPDQAKTRCAECHMPLQASHDFGAKAGEKFFADAKELSVHNHLFPGGNTALAYFRNEPVSMAAEQQYLQGVLRVDLFGVKAGGSIDSPLHAPLRPPVPTLKPSQKYLFEAVVRTLKMGHPYTQGTVDSNETWLDVTVTSGGQVIGRNGAIDDRGEVDRWAHFLNVFMLDRHGHRINRRNPQDIFVPLYNHQIPPGAAAVGHYEFQVPATVSAPVTVEVKLQYRKFDQEYMEFVTQTARPGDLPIRGYTPGQKYRNDLPVTTLAVDRITFPIEGVAAHVENAKVEIPEWQRWNDYGIALLLEGQGGAKGELRQAAEAFAQVEKLGRYDGPLNLARVYNTEGRIDEAVEAISRAAQSTDPAPPPWTIAWLSGLLNRQQGYLEAAEKNFRSVLEDHTPAMLERKFDFSLDYEVINELGLTLFERAKQQYASDRQELRESLLRQAAEQFRRTLQLDSENVSAHHNLHLLYAQLGEDQKAEEHRVWHERYKLDDNARDHAVAAARQKYPAANHAAEAVVIYPLQRLGAPGLAVTPKQIAVADR
ncbi:MAG: multiheme c-type cytochrome [Planctomycetota bacterium]|nr:multiheme c-type cytochrome [Planctomycetota bacterium]